MRKTLEEKFQICKEDVGERKSLAHVCKLREVLEKYVQTLNI